MKYITELTEQEILKLTDYDRKLMIKYKQAEDGIKIVVYPESPEYKKVAEKDVKIFVISGLSSGYYFADKKDAEKTASLLDTFKYLKYNYNYRDYNNRYVESVEDTSLFTVGTELAYSKKLYKDVDEDIQYNSTLKKDYEEKLKEYNSSQSDSEYIKKEVNDLYYEVIRKYEKLDKLSWQFNKEYLPLYKDFGDKAQELAMIAIKKAFSVSEEGEQYILNHLINE